jgi:hypothetical protein
MKKYEFDAVILKWGAQDAAFIEFPYEVETEFGVRGQVKVRATFDGIDYRGSLAKMGTHCHILGLTQQIRRAIGKQTGETVHVVLHEDMEPRTIDIPDDFGKLMDENHEARDFFNTLSYTNKKQYVLWISNAKKEETRKNRLEKSIGLLLNKVKHP